MDLAYNDLCDLDMEFGPDKEVTAMDGKLLGG